MKCERIREYEFAVIGAEWRKLFEKADMISPMLTWEWCFSWWESYKKLLAPCELYVLAVRDDNDELLGVAPFYILTAKKYGLRVRSIMFLGTGEPEEHETCSELLDIISVDDKRAVVADMVAEYLQNDNDWDELICRDIADVDDSVMGMVYRRFLNNKKIDAVIRSVGRCPVIKLPNSWDEYFDGLGKRTKKLVRYERRRIKKKVESEFAVVDNVNEIGDVLEEFKTLHQQRWVREGKGGCFASDEFTCFLDRVVGLCSEQGKVQFSTLVLDGDMAASFLLFRVGYGLFFYNSAVDIERYGKLSPGTVGLSYVIEDAIKNGFKEFHFFKGRAGSYKDRWTSDVVKVSDVCIARKNFSWSVRRFVGIFTQVVTARR